MSVYRKQARMVQEQSDTDAEQTTPTDTADEPVAVEAELTEAPTETDDEPVTAEAELADAPAETDDEPVAAEAELTEGPAETADEPVTADKQNLVGRLKSMWPGRRSKAAASSQDDEASPALDNADSETPLDTEEDGDVPTFVASTTRTATDDEPDSDEAARRTFAGRLRAMLPGRRSNAAATSPADDAASPALVDADSDTPLDTEEDGGVPKFEAPKAEPVTDDEPVAVGAAQSETPTAPEGEAVAVGAAQPEPLIDIPDSPFPIEAALAAKARLQQAQATPNERPTLRIVASSDMDGEVPAFLIDQIKRRKSVGGSLIDQQKPREVSAA